jgi:hypothetical protein
MFEPTCASPTADGGMCSAPAAWVNRRRTTGPQDPRERWLCDAHREPGDAYEPEAWSPFTLEPSASK